MDYNHYRLHSSMDYMAPAAFAATASKNHSGSQPVKLPPGCPNLPNCPNDFSPENNGKQIAFVSNRDGNYNIYIMEVPQTILAAADQE